MRIERGNIIWTADLASSTGTTVFPSGSSAGIATTTLLGNTPRNASGERVWVKVAEHVDTGTVSCFVTLYGYDDAGVWQYIGAINGGSAVAANLAKWSPTASTVVLSEAFTISPGQFSRLATRSYSPGGGGNTAAVSTWIGIEQV